MACSSHTDPIRDVYRPENEQYGDAVLCSGPVDVYPGASCTKSEAPNYILFMLRSFRASIPGIKGDLRDASVYDYSI